MSRVRAVFRGRLWAELMNPERSRLEQFRRWRQAAVWAPVFWFPLAVYAMAMRETRVALILGLSGLVFTLLARGVVWLGKCPRCEERFRDTPEGFKVAWDASRCLACGLSLFALRRGTQDDISERR